MQLQDNTVRGIGLGGCTRHTPGLIARAAPHDLVLFVIEQIWCAEHAKTAASDTCATCAVMKSCQAGLLITLAILIAAAGDLQAGGERQERALPWKHPEAGKGGAQQGAGRTTARCRDVTAP